MFINIFHLNKINNEGKKMTFCIKCGTKILKKANYCPECGSTLYAYKKNDNLANLFIKFLIIGFSGAFLSLLIEISFASVNLYFLPNFISSLIIILTMKIRDFKEAIIASLIIYLFSSAITSGLVLTDLFLNEVSLGSLYENYGVPTLFDIFIFTFNPLTSLIASFLGIKFSPKQKKSLVKPQKSENDIGGIIYILKNQFKKITPLTKFKYYLMRSSILNR